MSKVLVAFAMTEEFAPWRRRHHFRPLSSSTHHVWMTTFGATEVYAALAGAGAANDHHFRDLTTQLTPNLGIVTGVAAGLTPEWRSGDLLVAQTVCAPDGETRIASAAPFLDLAVQCGAKLAPALVTLRQVARTVAEKERLATSADAADMESLPVMERWSARGVPSLALRVILDPVEMPLTCDFEAAMDAHGQVRLTRILGQLARRPQLLPDFLLVARRSRRVLAVLAHFLDQFLDRFVGQTK